MTRTLSRVQSNRIHSATSNRTGLALIALLVAVGLLGSSLTAMAQPVTKKDDKAPVKTDASKTDAKADAGKSTTGGEVPKTDAKPDVSSAETEELKMDQVLKALLDDTLSSNTSGGYDKTENVEKAVKYFLQKDFDNARDMLNVAKSKNDLLPPAGIMMAKMLFLAKLNQYGMAELEQTMIKEPKDPEAYLLEADILFSQGFWSASQQMFVKAEQVNKESKETNAKRAKNFSVKINAGYAAVAEAQKRWEDAKTSIEKWIAVDPENPAAFLRLGRVYFKMKDFDKASKSFVKAEALSNAVKPKSGTNPNIVLARLYFEANEKDSRAKAIEELKTAVRGSAGNAEALLQAAAGFMQAKDLDKAKLAVDSALKADSSNVQAKYLKAVVCRMQGKLDEAETLLEALHKDAPGDFGITNQLALVLADSKSEASQRIALQHATNNFNSNQKNAEAATTLAWCVYKNGDKKRALEIMGEVAKQTQLSADSAYYIAMILKDLDKRDDALKVLKEATKVDAPFFVHEDDAKKLLDKLSGN